ncbi:MAG: PilZ domain-containing protein [Acidobacteriota bacterium]|nr:PilZ domain-containing protein [Acidobacteriota bacterium]
MFVRSRDENGKEFLEFATALNVSPGGALIAVRRPLPPSAKVSLEIPSAPLASSIEVRKAARNLQARILRSSYSEGFHLLGIKFAHSLLNHASGKAELKKKVVSSV